MRDTINSTHAELSARSPRPCTPHDLTFGGRCLNCGYDPNPAQTAREREQIKRAWREDFARR